MMVLGQKLGYRVANQREAERLFVRSGFSVEQSELKRYCDKYDFFQDVPFCIPSYRRVLLALYPTARFVLTVRRDFETWYSSVCRYYAGICNTPSLPTHEDMARTIFCGAPLSDNMYSVYERMDRRDPFNKATMLAYYSETNNGALDEIPAAQLMVVDVSDDSVLQELFRFLGVTPTTRIRTFPHANKGRKKIARP